jgi:hypothetical protein
MKQFSEDDDRFLLASLQNAVREALERKLRLGQYAVVWQAGRPVFIRPNPLAEPGRYSTKTLSSFDGVRDSGESD